MEARAQSNGNGSDNGKKKRDETETSAAAAAPSSLTEATIAKVSKRRRTRSSATTRSYYFDSKAQGYEWLLPGWIAEERHMETGRVYRYYYDPEGNRYHTQYEVINAWEQAGVVFID